MKMNNLWMVIFSSIIYQMGFSIQSADPAVIMAHGRAKRRPLDKVLILISSAVLSIAPEEPWVSFEN